MALVSCRQIEGFWVCVLLDNKRNKTGSTNTQERRKFLHYHMPTVVKITKKYSQLVYIPQIIGAVYLDRQYLGIFSSTFSAKLGKSLMRVRSSHTCTWHMIGKNSYFGSLAVVWIVPVHAKTHWLYERACCHIMLNVNWLFMALTSPYHHYTMLQLTLYTFQGCSNWLTFSVPLAFKQQVISKVNSPVIWNAPAALIFFFIVLNTSSKPLSCPLPLATFSEMHNTKCTWSSLGWISKRASFLFFQVKGAWK